jgi:anti-sigma factor RsiW
MNCSDFEKRLERYQAGMLPEAESRETARHLFHCPSCRALLEAVQSGENQLGQPDLSEAVLSRTSGPACRRCRNLFGDLLDGLLQPIDTELILSHLKTCPSCSSLFHAMSEMSEVLPRMREVLPDAAFVPEVLRSTRALRHDGSGLSRIIQFVRALTERPRFSWEAAYLGALLVFALFGTPFSPVHDASSRLLASLQDQEGLIARAESSIRGWQQDAKIALEATDRARQSVGWITARSAETVESVIAQGRDYGRQSEAYIGSLEKALKTWIADIHRQVRESKTPQR